MCRLFWSIRSRGVNEWLQVTYNHRKGPRNDMDPPSLKCMDALGKRGRDMIISGDYGPGVSTILSIFSDETARKAYSVSSTKGQQRRDRRRPDFNPMGDSVPTAASKYGEVPARDKSSILPEDDSTQLPSTRNAGIFSFSFSQSFLTEPDPDEFLQRSSSSSSSVPTLPNLDRVKDSSRPSGVSERVTDSNRTSGASEEDPSRMSSAVSRPPRTTGGGLSPKRSLELAQQRRIFKSFQGALDQKSVLVFTDTENVRKSICSALMELSSAVCFVKNKKELLQQLQGRRKHHFLMIDITMPDMDAEAVIRMIRFDAKYRSTPIVVIATENTLTASIRTSCNFVVFHPPVNSMVREALLWCHDKAALHSVYPNPRNMRRSTSSSTSSCSTFNM